MLPSTCPPAPFARPALPFSIQGTVPGRGAGTVHPRGEPRRSGWRGASSGRHPGKPVPGSPAARTTSRPLAGQGHERPRLAVREASEMPAGLHLAGASAAGARSGGHRPAPSPCICSYRSRAFSLAYTDGARGARKALPAVRCCEMCVV